MSTILDNLDIEPEINDLLLQEIREKKKNREHRASRGPRGPFGTRSGIFNFDIILTSS